MLQSAALIFFLFRYDAIKSKINIKLTDIWDVFAGENNSLGIWVLKRMLYNILYTIQKKLHNMLHKTICNILDLYYRIFYISIYVIYIFIYII